MLNFLHPALLAGALLFTVPLIIHLLNRQRYKRRDWAAMEFLLAAYKKQRRRLRQESLLLLLLRCLIPIVLALAIARPVLRDSSVVGGELGAVHHVLVFDQSASMGVQLEDGSKPLARAKTLASKLVDRAASGDNAVRFSIFVQGLRSRQLRGNSSDTERVKAAISSIGPPIDTGTDLTESLLEAAELAEEETDAVIVHLFTDLQERSFGDDFGALGRDDDEALSAPDAAGPAEPAVPDTDSDIEIDISTDTARDAIDRIDEAGDFRLYDLASSGRNGAIEDNLQITSLRLLDGHALRGASATVIATVRNRSDVTRTVRATLLIDGGQPLRESTDIEPGAEQELEFETTFTELGSRRLEARLETDSLEFDDVRRLVVEVRDAIRVLAVENVSEDDPQLQESTHIVTVLDPTGDDGPADLNWFDILTVDKLDLLTGRVRPGDFDLVILANLSQLGSGDVASSLTEAVRTGTGLLVMAGSDVDTDSYNRALHQDGLGPMPIRLLGSTGFEPGGDQYFSSFIEAPNHPVFQDLPDDTFRTLLEKLPVYRVLRSEWPEEDPSTTAVADGISESDVDEVVRSSQTLLSAQDALTSPLWIASKFGAGRALFLTSPISSVPGKWNQHDTSLGGLSFLVLWPMARWLTLPNVDDRNVVAGAVLTTSVDSEPRDPRVLAPERATSNSATFETEPKTLPGGRFGLPPYDATAYAGFYDYQFLDADDRDRTVTFVVDPMTEEGDLRYFTPETVNELLGVDDILLGLEDDALDTDSSGSDDFGPWLLGLLVALLCGEAAMARFVTRRRA
ncbi:MAG: BatA domain-containing protein [Planctomycetota bacterium]